MALIRCPECGKEISDTAGSCPNCGYSFTRTKFCKFCGERIPENSVICPKCGRQVENQVVGGGGGVVINNVSTASSSASATATNVLYRKKINKTVALILCILLGWCGGHKFYEGKPVMGILYIFTVGLFGIGWLIDLIVIALKPNPYYV